MEKIILKNWENGTKFKDYLAPEAPEFNITNGVAYLYGENMISPATAKARGLMVEIDEKFILPPDVNDRIKVSSYIQNVLGIDRQRDHDLYFKLWKKMGESLEAGRLVLGQNRNNNSQ